MATVKINGKEITVEDGTLILDAARKAGFEIPTMCYHARLSKLASCRVCLVEIVGQRKLQPSCVTPVMHEMEVLTESPVVQSARSAMIELLLANHPLDCPVCDKGGECELQDVTFGFGPRKSPFSDVKRRFHEEDYLLSPVIVQNANRCIQCKRCVRICAEVVGAGVLGSIDRGAKTAETSFVREYLDCDHCGNCIEVCPVGSLMSRPYRYKSRPWDLTGIDTVCTYCGTGCQLTVQARRGEVVRVISKPDKGINNETLCARGRFGYSFIDSHERLVTPLIRKDGILEPASWEEALQAVRNGLEDSMKSGKKIGGIASARLSNEELYLFQKLMRGVLKTNNIDSGSRWKTGNIRSFVQLMEMDKGGSSVFDAFNANTLLIIGSSISDENPITDYLIRRLSRDRKMNILIASPKGMKLDSSATLNIRHKPGKEGEVLAGLAKIIHEKNTVKLKDLSGIDKLKSITSGKISSVAGIAEGTITSAAELMLSSNSITIVVGNDVLRGSSRLEFLPLLTGALRQLGKDVKLFPLFDRANQRGAWEMGVHPVIQPGYKFTGGDASGCEEILEASSAGEIDALYIAGEDIISDFPDGLFARDALKQVKFLIVQDIFLSETAKMASVVLPGASFAEKDGTFTNQEGRVQRLRKFFDPRGDAMADWKIFTSVAGAIDPSFYYESVSDVFEEIKGAVPMYSEIDFENLDGNGAIVKGAESTPYSQPSTPYSPKEESSDPEHPFILITGNHLYHSGRLSQKADTLHDILPEAIAELNEEDARAMGIVKGDKIRVIGKRYEATLTAHINKRSVRGVVFVPENFTDVCVNMFFTRGVEFARVKITKG